MLRILCNEDSLENFLIRVIYFDKTLGNRPLQKTEKEKPVYSG